MKQHEEYRIYGACVMCSDGSCPSCQDQLPASRRTMTKRVIEFKRIGWSFTWEMTLECKHKVRVIRFRTPADLNMRCEECGGGPQWPTAA